MSAPIRLIVADDHRLVRAGIIALLQDMTHFDVVGEASNGQQALELVTTLQPDILLLDLNMPVLSGLECLQQLVESGSSTRVLILSMHHNEEHVRRALELGASGYLLKASTAQDLELALRTVMQGHLWLSAEVAAQLRGPVGADMTPTHLPSTGSLTSRQLEVLKRLAEGASVKEIAFELSLSVKTVETYRSQIMERLGLRDLPALVRYAIRQQIIDL